MVTTCEPAALLDRPPYPAAVRSAQVGFDQGAWLSNAARSLKLCVWARLIATVKPSHEVLRRVGTGRRRRRRSGLERGRTPALVPGLQLGALQRDAPRQPQRQRGQRRARRPRRRRRGLQLRRQRARLRARRPLWGAGSPCMARCAQGPPCTSAFAGVHFLSVHHCPCTASYCSATPRQRPAAGQASLQRVASSTLIASRGCPRMRCSCTVMMRSNHPRCS